MRTEGELQDIARAMANGEAVFGSRLAEDRLLRVFPSLLDVTLRQALEFERDGVVDVFQFRSKADPDGTFREHQTITREEMDIVRRLSGQEATPARPPGRPPAHRRHRRFHRRQPRGEGYGQQQGQD